MGLDHHMFGPTLSDIWELYTDGIWDCECHFNISEWDWKEPSIDGTFLVRPHRMTIGVDLIIFFSMG